jgi:hypothetical protein
MVLMKKENEQLVSLVKDTYDRRYTGSITGRYDGSNRQGNSNSSRWLPTYTFSGKWNIMEEDHEGVCNLSLRGSYGLTATAGPATNISDLQKLHYRSFKFRRQRPD